MRLESRSGVRENSWERVCFRNGHSVVERKGGLRMRNDEMKWKGECLSRNNDICVCVQA